MHLTKRRKTTQKSKKAETPVRFSSYKSSKTFTYLKATKKNTQFQMICLAKQKPTNEARFVPSIFQVYQMTGEFLDTHCLTHLIYTKLTAFIESLTF
jgi:hypothetical protein